MDWLPFDLGTAFMPHGHCFVWKPHVLIPLIVGNLGAASAYLFGFRAAVVATLEAHGVVLDSEAAVKLKRFVNWCGAGHFGAFLTLFWGYYALFGLLLCGVAFVSWDFVLCVREKTEENGTA